MGNSSSKQRYMMQPQPGPYAPFIPPSYGPQYASFPPPMGWPPPPQAYPGMVAGGMPMMVQPWPSTRRKKHRRHSTSSAGHRVSASPRRTTSTMRHTPERTQTPFIPPGSNRHADVSRSTPANQPRSILRTATPAPPRREVEPSDSESPEHHRHEPDIERILQPPTPAGPSVYGPPGDIPRSDQPLRNPLPPPPRDLYETSPYKALLNLPQTAALFSAGLSQTNIHDVDSKKTDLFGRKKSTSRKGLFRGLLGGSRKGEEGAAAPTIRVAPLFLNGQPNGSSQPGAGAAATRAMNMPEPVVQQQQQPASVPPPQPQPQPGVGEVPPILFNHMGPYSCFMPHSPHRVNYETILFPSATHLHEAMKYLPHRPDCAHAICEATDVADVYPLSAQFQPLQRHDWGDVFLNKMTEALFLKFTQHTDLKSMLLGTGMAPLIYSDPNDPFWGDGPDGQGRNELGKALERVRDRLRTMSFTF